MSRVYHSSKQVAEAAVATARRNASRASFPVPLAGQTMPALSQKPAKKETNGTARKRAAAYSSLYRDDKKGVDLVKPLRSKQQWPDPDPNLPRKKQPSKDRVIVQLLAKDGYTPQDAVLYVHGADLIDDRFVRGILVFSQPSGKPGRVKKKRIVTPKGFWSVKLDFARLINNYQEGFRGLREKRLREGVDMHDLVEWGDIQAFQLYIDCVPESEGKKKRRPVPIDSRKASDLLVEFDSRARGAGNPRKRKLPSGEAQGRGKEPGRGAAIEQLNVLTADPKNIECASNMVKDHYILPCLFREGGEEEEEAVVLDNMAAPIIEAVDANCPDGVNRYLSAKEIREGSGRWNTIILDTDRVENKLQRIRCQYECDIPTHDDLLVVGRIHLRDLSELERGNHIVRGHARHVTDAVNIIAKASLKAKGVDVDALAKDASVTEAEPEPEPSPPPKKKKRGKKRKPKEVSPPPPSPPATAPEWLAHFAYIKAPLVKVFRQMRARVLEERGAWFYDKQIDHVMPVVDALIGYSIPADKNLLDHGLDLMLAMITAAKQIHESREFCALVFYFCYFTFLRATREQELPWYSTPKRKKGGKGKGKAGKIDIDDLLGGGGLWFEEEEGSGGKGKGEREEGKVPSLYDEDLVYSEISNWAQMAEGSAARRRVFRLRDQRQVAVRLCAVAEAIHRDSRDKVPKRMNALLKMDSITTLDDLIAHPVFAQPMCFWLWMAFMHELFVGPISEGRTQVPIPEIQ